MNKQCMNSPLSVFGVMVCIDSPQRYRQLAANAGSGHTEEALILTNLSYELRQANQPVRHCLSLTCPCLFTAFP